MQSLAKSEQTRFLDNLSDSHISGVMQAITYPQMNALQQFVSTFIVEAKRVETVLNNLLKKKQ